MTPDKATLEQRLVGGLLMAGGATIFLACGRCTMNVIVPSVATLLHHAQGSPAADEGTGWQVLALMAAPAVGGVPTLVGAAIIAVGFSTLRGCPPVDPVRAAAGGTMMAVGSAIGWLSAMALSSDVMVCFHDGFSRQTTGLWAVGSIAAGVTAAALTTIWFGWKIARGARGPETRKRPAPPF